MRVDNEAVKSDRWVLSLLQVLLRAVWSTLHDFLRSLHPLAGVLRLSIIDNRHIACAADAPDSVNRLRTQEFARLGHTAYLDHAGTTLYSERQLQDAYADLAQHVLGNPHSNDGMAARIQEARRLTLQLLHAAEDTYEVIFTSGATGAKHVHSL